MRVPSPDPQGEGHERCVDQQETGFAPAPAPHFFGARFWLLLCRALGISVQPARPYTPTDKAIVERTFHSINTLFCQHVAGYVGGNVTMRGKDPGADAVFTVAQLQDLFDEWVVAVWQNRPHESLTHLWGQSAAVSPNDAYGGAIPPGDPTIGVASRASGMVRSHSRRPTERRKAQAIR